MAKYQLITDFGVMQLEVSVTKLTGIARDRHYDKEWSREVTLASVDKLCKVNRDYLRFQLSWRARSVYYEPFDASRIYDVTRDYMAEFIYKVEGGAAPKGAVAKLNKWADEFIPLWLEANPCVWITAEKEGKAAEAERLATEVAALKERIVTLNVQAARCAQLAQRFAEQEGARIATVGNVVSSVIA